MQKRKKQILFHIFVNFLRTGLSDCSLASCLPHQNKRMSLRGGPPNVDRRGTEGNTCGAISSTAERYCIVSINIENPGCSMLIGQNIVQLRCWRLPHQSADRLAMTWWWVPGCVDLNSSPNFKFPSSRKTGAVNRARWGYVLIPQGSDRSPGSRRSSRSSPRQRLPP